MLHGFSTLAHQPLLKGEMNANSQARIIRQEVAITDVEGDTLEMGWAKKAKSMVRE